MNRLVGYLCKEDSIKSLLQWVISGLDELDQQATEAHSALFDHAISLYPSYQGRRNIPGPGPGSPPLEPLRIPDPDPDPDSLGEANPVTSVDLEGDRTGFTSGITTTSSETASDDGRSRYPAISTEVLTSELWLLTETVMQHKENLLRPFWEAVLPPLDPPSSTLEELAASRPEQSERDRARDEFWSEKDEERERKREMIRGMWVRVNAAFMKRTAEVCSIQLDSKMEVKSLIEKNR